MRVLSLCAGIGGFDLAAEWAGHEVVGQVEIDPFCLRVLAKHWPGVPRIPDIFDVKGDEFGPVDLVTAGFPCQPYSVAGKRRGAGDDRALWPEVFRVTAACRPRWFLGENVAGFIRLALDDCLADLEAIGYEAWAVVLPACAVGAWHRRDRVWIVAHADEGGRGSGESPLLPRPLQSDPARCGEDVADAARELPHGSGIAGTGRRSESSDRRGPTADTDGGRHGAPQRAVPPWRYGALGTGGRDVESGICGVAARLPGWVDGTGTEAPPGLTEWKVPSRANRLKALGDAIVPQVAYEIIRLMD